MTSDSSTTHAESIIEKDGIQLADSTADMKKKSIYGTETMWRMAPELLQIRERDEEGGEKPKMLGVAWDNLTVKGVGGDATFNENVLSQLFSFHRRGKGSKTRTIIENSFGYVKPGEMLLVLERPGTGCTTLLNILINNYLGYEEVTGHVSFGNISIKKARQYRGQIIINMEKKIFFLILSIEDIINFTARMKVLYQLFPEIMTHEKSV